MEISTEEAGRMIGLTSQAIRDHIRANRLPAQRRGVRQEFVIQLADLRAFALRWNYPLDESVLQDGKG